MKIGLALGSGGSRGLAHIGVLRGIEKEGIKIDMISGTSIGAIVGAMFAYGYNSEEIESKVRQYLQRPHILKILNYMKKTESKGNSTFGSAKQWLREKLIFTRAVTRVSLIQNLFLKQFIDEVFPGGEIEFKIPFRAVAANLTNLELAVFKSENAVNMRDAILASAAIPGVFPPVEIDGCKYSDGAVVSPVPVSVLKEEGLDFIIGIALPKRLEAKSDFSSGAEVFLRASRASVTILFNQESEQADLLIPAYISGRSWSDFEKMSVLIEDGEKAFYKSSDDLKQKIKEKKRTLFWDNVIKTVSFKQLSTARQEDK
ncbi:patatin-like phospholipase family protein [bacterium]|nr:patatin-like phospholipase family protein [bacterium]